MDVVQQGLRVTVKFFRQLLRVEKFPVIRSNQIKLFPTGQIVFDEIGQLADDGLGRKGINETRSAQFFAGQGLGLVKILHEHQLRRHTGVNADFDQQSDYFFQAVRPEAGHRVREIDFLGARQLQVVADGENDPGQGKRFRINEMDGLP